MSDLAKRIAETQVTPGQVAVFWLGQAGFAFKTAAGRIIYIDPYLSDAAERLFGFRRLMPSPLRPEEVVADAVISTHEHADHLDPDALPVIARGTAALFVGSPGCRTGYEKLGIPSRRVVCLPAGGTMQLGGVRLIAVAADHGEQAPDAIGVVLDFDGLAVYHTGDTALGPQLANAVADLQVRLLLPVINGAYGNMTARDAASLTAAVRPGTAIPIHFGMFAEHGGDPEAFRRACAEMAPEVEVLILEPGQVHVLERQT